MGVFVLRVFPQREIAAYSVRPVQFAEIANGREINRRSGELNPHSTTQQQLAGEFIDMLQDNPDRKDRPDPTESQEPTATPASQDQSVHPARMESVVFAPSTALSTAASSLRTELAVDSKRRSIYFIKNILIKADTLIRTRNNSTTTIIIDTTCNNRIEIGS